MYYKKFNVTRVETGEEVTERTFTILVDSDPFAVPALQAYAEAAEDANYHDLAEGLFDLVEEIQGAN